MAGKRTAALRMHRTADQTCILPGFLANVFLAGEPDLKSKLHRPQARTAATVAGLLCYGIPAIMSVMNLACLSAGETAENKRLRSTSVYSTRHLRYPAQYFANKLPVVST